jgi:nitrite reductase/ring-hydroxylating ferredoxin subunit
MPNFVRIASKADVPAGAGRAFEVDGKQVALFNCGGMFYAIENECKHQGGPLGEGDLDGTIVTCPWHAWTYDVTSGASPDDPDCRVGCYPVRIEGDDVLVDLGS